MHVSSSDRVAAALLRIDYAEEVLRQARRILEYEEMQAVPGSKTGIENYIKEPTECEE